jgi:hypothetical protein
MKFARLIPLVVGSIWVFGCDGNGTNVAPSTPATLNIMLKDAPFADARAVFVTFAEVSVRTSTTDFTTVPFANNVSARTCDLKQLMSASDLLGSGTLTTGHYTQIRLVVASATLFFDNPAAGPPCGAVLPMPQGRNASASVLSGEVRLNQEFDISTSKATTIVVDFDGGRSLNVTGTGGYMLLPVMSVVSVQ